MMASNILRSPQIFRQKTFDSAFSLYGIRYRDQLISKRHDFFVLYTSKNLSRLNSKPRIFKCNNQYSSQLLSYVKLLLISLFLSISSPVIFAQSATPKPLSFYLEDLVSASKDMNGYNYQRTVYQKVCPYMEILQQIEQTQKINPKTRRHFLAEVVKIYDKVFDFSGNHHLMYCVYHYYSPTKSSKEFFEIAERIVSPSKLSFLKDRYETCDQEEKEGNGDGANILSKKESSYFIPKEQYQKMSASLRLSYIKKTKKNKQSVTQRS